MAAVIIHARICMSRVKCMQMVVHSLYLSAQHTSPSAQDGSKRNVKRPSLGKKMTLKEQTKNKKVTEVDLKQNIGRKRTESYMQKEREETQIFLSRSRVE